MDENETLVILAVNVEPFQLALFKEALEENGIDCFVTGGTNAYGSRGIMYVSRGIATYTIKVRKKDEQKAIVTMEQLGYKAFSEDEEEQNFLRQLAYPTEKIPFLAKYPLNTRLTIMGLAVTAIIIVLMFWFYRR